MVELARAPSESSGFRAFTPIAFEGSSRLNFKRLRRPTSLPSRACGSAFGRCLDRLNRLVGGS